MTKEEEFELATKAFCLMNTAERHVVLEQFSKLRYPSVPDRFFEAVHLVIAARTSLWQAMK